MSTVNYRLLLIDDHPLVLSATSELLRGIFPGVDLHTASDLSDIDSMASEMEFQGIISDLMLPGCQPTDVMQRLEAVFPRAKLIFLSGMESTDSLVQVIREKGHLFLHKAERYKKMVEQLRGHLNVQFAFDMEASNEYRSLIQVAGHKPLTKKQATVMEFVSQGQTIKEVARKMDLSPETVRAHLKECYVRLDANSRAEAVSAFMTAKKLSEQIHDS